MQYSNIPKYCDSGSILLVNLTGDLRRLYCPFRVECLITNGLYQQGMWLWVEEVACGPADELIYLILGKPYPYGWFAIKASF